MDDLDLKVDLPELPQSMRLVETESPTLDQRWRAIELFSKTLDLGDLQPVDLPNSIAYAGKRGEVEFFPASGALWARDAEAEEASDNELRDWPDLEEVEKDDDDDVIIVLSPSAADALVSQAQELFSAADLISEYMKPRGVALEQVIHLSEKGDIIARGAGVATVIFDYELDGFPVFGAGAKSQTFVEPSREGSRTIGAFHCWRTTVADRMIKLQPVEEALAVGVLQDLELNLYFKRDGRIEIKKLDFGYMALPAMVRQRYLFPVFQIEGRVYTPDRKQEYFEFARYHHAVPAKQYSEVGAFADYLVKRND
jgi:hypothetical protein